MSGSDLIPDLPSDILGKSFRVTIILTIPFFGALFCCCIASSQIPAPDPAPDIDRITELAKTYFRDSAELPMDVAVTTIVKDRAGKLKREAHATVHMVFHGYNQSGKFTVSSRSGLLDRKELHDSMNGDLAAFAAGTLLLKRRDRSNFQVHQPTQTGQPFLVTIDDQDCPEFELIGGRVVSRPPGFRPEPKLQILVMSKS